MSVLKINKTQAKLTAAFCLLKAVNTWWPITGN